MNGQDFYPEASRSLESLRHMRLTALLHDMIGDCGKVKAGRALGVNYRTLSRAVESGTLTDRMADALERHLLLGGGSAAAQQRERVGSLEKRLAELELDLGGGLKAAVEEVKAFREEQARYRQHVERRLLRVENRVKEGAVSPQSGMEPEAPKLPYVPRRQYPQLVTEEAEPDEGQVYGDATPVIVEWRKARDAYHRASETGTEVEIRNAHERMLWLEVAIIEEHELTLPPASYPWGREERRVQDRKRRGEVIWSRVERKKALRRLWVRRVLTLGLWRN
ncbi:MAG: hypothetical protein OYI31_06505 [Chloroflexota bacterium]|nr:hypothetical protein [Chloroflexota bacterium]MDE2965330.1 hypothetical protein [Acidobacteriota bacterium]MDE3268082.1 hypothetical protein [Chloroflexota bacterium]